MIESNSINQHLERWNRELSGIYDARELRSMWRLLLSLKDAAGDTAPPDFEQVIGRLKVKEPFAYIIGHTEFFGLTFFVDRSVLIPRPETEELVEWILADRGEKSMRVLDIGTGSGCIAVALAHRRPQWDITALDNSPEALSIALRNAEYNRVSVKFLQADILSEEIAGEFDIIVSNPPYIPMSERGRMGEGPLRYEPAGALFTGTDDALVFYRRIGLLAKGFTQRAQRDSIEGREEDSRRGRKGNAKGFTQRAQRVSREGRKDIHGGSHLAGGGAVYFELNEFHADAIRALIEEMGFSAEVRQDMQGKDRMLRAFLQPPDQRSSKDA